MNIYQTEQLAQDEKLTNNMGQAILSALEYRGFYDCGKYLDDTFFEYIKPIILSRDTALLEAFKKDVEKIVEELIKKNEESLDFYVGEHWSTEGYPKGLTDLLSLLKDYNLEK